MVCQSMRIMGIFIVNLLLISLVLIEIKVWSFSIFSSNSYQKKEIPYNKRIIFNIRYRQSYQLLFSLIF